jgi:hypothetical protein
VEAKLLEKNPKMSVFYCQTCRDLIEDASFAIKRHLEAMAALALAIQRNDNPEEISAREDAVRACSLDRENAVVGYETHLVGHGEKTMVAGSGPSAV